MPVNMIPVVRLSYGKSVRQYSGSVEYQSILLVLHKTAVPDANLF